MLLNPEIIREHFGKLDAGVPVVVPSGPLLLVDMEHSRFGNGPMSIPDVITSDRLTGFYFSRTAIHLIKMRAENTVCRGYLCDALDLTFRNKKNAEYCPCFTMKYQDGQTVLDLQLEIEVLDESLDRANENICIDSFTSRITSKLLTGEFITHGDRTLIINSGRITRIYRLMKEFIDMVNVKLGWNAGRWFRRGYIDDTGAKGKSKVKSAELNYHLTFLRYNGQLDDESKNIIQRIKDLLNNTASQQVFQNRPAGPNPEAIPVEARADAHLAGPDSEAFPVEAHANAHPVTASNRTSQASPGSSKRLRKAADLSVTAKAGKKPR